MYLHNSMDVQLLANYLSQTHYKRDRVWRTRQNKPDSSHFCAPPKEDPSTLRAEDILNSLKTASDGSNNLINLREVDELRKSAALLTDAANLVEPISRLGITGREAENSQVSPNSI